MYAIMAIRSLEENGDLMVLVFLCEIVAFTVPQTKEYCTTSEENNRLEYGKAV